MLSVKRIEEPLLPPDPQPCPAGWVTGPPDFVGVGAQRCGTTWWHRQIAMHPGVRFRNGLHFKEVHFFDSLRGVRVGPEHAERYARYFARPEEGGVVGEWTPRYMYDGWPLAQIGQLAPAARILVMLRDPVDRYASGRAREDRLARDRGFYAAQVARVLETFGSDRVLVLQYERCRSDYGGQLARTYAFLGLDPEFRPGAPRAAPREPRERDVPAAERERLGRGYAPDVARLAEIAPEVDPALWPGVRDLL